MSKHTPGTRKAEGPYQSGWDVVHGSGREAECVASYCTEQDARLIAAAPDLLAVLVHLYRHGYTTGADHDRVVAVITQATGEEPNV